MGKLWLHSLCCAYSAKVITMRLRIKDGERYFQMGLLHDIGKVFLFGKIGGILGKDDSMDMAELYITIKGFHHKFTGAMLKRWGFEAGFISTILSQENAASNPNSEKDALIINLANNLSYRMGCGLTPKESEQADLSAAEKLGLDMNTVGSITDRVMAIMKDSVSAF